ncbi:hypothetical protein MNBD_GAMMA16-1960 [hydrothermal vent metagenome]|uniref:Type IV fimbrial biogenesis protein PilV n=1 Tax=hydrothermal vent metagenome TaxID=652676 RepID=A0A3B1A565_9ZZZZ
MTKKTYYDPQSGLSLIELLVSLAIFSFGILSMAQLQTYALKTTALNLQTKQAIQLSQQIAESITANPAALILNSYEVDVLTTPLSTPCSPTCTASQHALNSLSNWKHDIITVLPGGEGSIQKSGNIYNILITWPQAGQSTNNNCSTALTLAKKHCFSYPVSVL